MSAAYFKLKLFVPFYAVSPSDVTPEVIPDDSFDTWTLGGTVLWSHTDFPIDTTRVSVEVIGYCEPSIGAPEIKVLYECSNDVIVADEHFEVERSNQGTLCDDNQDCTSIGAIRIRDLNSGIGTLLFAVVERYGVISIHYNGSVLLTLKNGVPTSGVNAIQRPLESSIRYHVRAL
ncbi:hypothetical protein BSL78_25789 [Apostichopus japonicus]|uniref:Uncharacterized protein n=1 Tax=Stichopus japonicus TaxID=307972 RepID=A0A2G8JNN7_STIJA|nr:hypothetical protein BSL78_25789 [Apostichopus japonicus]